MKKRPVLTPFLTASALNILERLINSIHKAPAVLVSIEKVLPIQGEHVSICQTMSMPAAYEWK